MFTRAWAAFALASSLSALVAFGASAQGVNSPPRCWGYILPPNWFGGPIEPGETGIGGFGCADEEDDELSYSVVAGPSHGSITELTRWSNDEVGRTNWGFEYIPSAEYVGYDSVTLTASDGTNDSEPVEIGIWIEPRRDDPPRCFSEPLLAIRDGLFGYPAPGLVPSGGKLRGLWSCTDDEGQPVTYAVERDPQYGELVFDTTSGPLEFTYVADSKYEGLDEFALSVSDGTLTRVSEPVAVSVGAGSEETSESAPFGPEAIAIERRRLLARGGFTDIFAAPAKGTVVDRLKSSVGRIVLAKGRRPIPHAGKFKVKLRLTRDGRSRLRRARQPLYASLTVEFRRPNRRLTRQSRKVVVLP